MVVIGNRSFKSARSWRGLSLLAWILRTDGPEFLKYWNIFIPSPSSLVSLLPAPVLGTFHPLACLFLLSMLLLLFFGWEGGGDCFFGLLVTNLFQVILRDLGADSRGERQIKRAKSVRAEFTRRAGTAPGRIPLTD